MPVPALAPWNFSPGIDPYTQVAHPHGVPAQRAGAQRIGILADPTARETNVQVAIRIAEHFGHPIPEDCVVLKRSQEASSGMRSEIARLRTCYNGQAPDAVLALDALQGVFGAMEAAVAGLAGGRRKRAVVLHRALVLGDRARRGLRDGVRGHDHRLLDPALHPLGGRRQVPLGREPAEPPEASTCPASPRTP